MINKYDNFSNMLSNMLENVTFSYVVKHVTTFSFVVKHV